MSVENKLQSLRTELPENVTLVAVSKTRSETDILKAYTQGQRIFGENKAHEMSNKYETLPKDIQWHMIGHLQRNKVKYIAPFVSLIHSVDSLRLLKEINKQAKKENRIINCLLQVKIAEEDSKYGLTKTELVEIIEHEIAKYKHVKILGLMGMATFTDNSSQIKSEFQSLEHLFKSIKTNIPDVNILSIGMSNDYPIALECGSTMVRIGSRIFGKS